MQRRDGPFKPRVIARNRPPALRDERLNLGCQLLDRPLLQVMKIEPEQFLSVEYAGRFPTRLKAEKIDQLILREDFLVAVRPSKPREIVQHRLGEVTVLAIRNYRSRA